MDDREGGPEHRGLNEGQQERGTNGIPLRLITGGLQITAEEGAEELYPPLPVAEQAPLPDPAEVFLRAARLGATRMRPEREEVSDITQSVFYNVPADLGEAFVTLRKESTVTRLNVQARRGEPLWRLEHTVSIGHYNAMQGSWTLYPEYVHPEEQAAVASLIARDNLIQRGYPDRHGVILHHPVTMAARQEMAAYLEQTGLTTRLPEQAYRGGLRYDEHTSATLLLAPTYGDHGPNPPMTLVVAYQGLIVDANGLRERRSGPEYFSIAFRDPKNPNQWEPRSDMITRAEWVPIADAPLRLLEYEQRDFRFSAAECAIMTSQTFPAA